MKTSKINVPTKVTAKPKTASTRQIMDITSRIRKIKRNIKKINNLFLVMVAITLIPYSAMFADWCREISNDSTYFSVVGLLILSYIMLCGLIYAVTVKSVIEEKEERIAYLKIERSELMKRADEDILRLINGIKFKRIVSQSSDLMED